MPTLLLLFAKCARDLIYECALPAPGAPVMPMRSAPRCAESTRRVRLRCGGIVFDQRNRPRQRTQVTGADVRQRGTSGLESGVQGASVAANRIAVQGRLRSSRAITMR